MPTISGRMISYVSPFCIMPCWWIPASCEKAFRPTIALLGWGKLPVRYESSWLVR